MCGLAKEIVPWDHFRRFEKGVPHHGRKHMGYTYYPLLLSSIVMSGSCLVTLGQTKGYEQRALITLWVGDELKDARDDRSQIQQ